MFLVPEHICIPGTLRCIQRLSWTVLKIFFLFLHYIKKLFPFSIRPEGVVLRQHWGTQWKTNEWMSEWINIWMNKFPSASNPLVIFTASGRYVGPSEGTRDHFRLSRHQQEPKYCQQEKPQQHRSPASNLTPLQCTASPAYFQRLHSLTICIQVKYCYNSNASVMSTVH